MVRGSLTPRGVSAPAAGAVEILPANRAIAPELGELRQHAIELNGYVGGNLGVNLTDGQEKARLGVYR